MQESAAAVEGITDAIGSRTAEVVDLTDDPEDRNSAIESKKARAQPKDIDDDVSLSVDGYSNRSEFYRAYYLNETFEQHAKVLNAWKFGDVDPDYVESKLAVIRKREGDSDFVMQPIIRLLYFDYENRDNVAKESVSTWEKAHKDILSAFEGFPFWPTEGVQNMDNIVFWSENHLFMTLSAAYLYHQFRHKKHSDHVDDAWESQYIECRLLHKYLELHLHRDFNGVFEANSHVYLPFTIIALLNLIDFAKNEALQSKAWRLVDRIVQLVVLNYDPYRGVGNLVASARAFARTRLRNHGHNINILLYLVMGKCPRKYEAASLLSHILLSKWRPNYDDLTASLTVSSFESPQISPPIPILRKLIDDLSEPDLTFFELTPFLWSAGLITHPDFVQQTQRYIHKYRLNHNVHLWPMSFLFSSDVVDSYRHFTSGQAYTNIKENIYKAPHHGVLLTSFQEFSGHRAAYQQLSWMLNFVGIPIWSQSGAGSESMAGFALTNTHNPIVKQKDDILVMTYLAPRMLTSTLAVGTVFSYQVRMFVPPDIEGILDSAQLVVHGRSYQQSLEWLTDRVKNLRKRNGAPVGKAIRSVVRFIGGKKAARQLPLKAVTNTASIVATQLTGGKINNDDVRGFFRDFWGDREHNLEATLYQENKVNRLWRVLQRDQAYVGILCTKNITEIQSNRSKDSTLEFYDDVTKELRKEAAIRLVCHSPRQSWIVVVGTSEDYSSVEDFVDNRLRHIVFNERDERRSTGHYHLTVNDPKRDVFFETHV